MLPVRTAALLCCATFLCGLSVDSLLSQESESEKPDPQEQRDPWTYELRTYTTADGKLDALHARFREHTMTLFEKHGMKNVAYWTIVKDTPAEDRKNTLVYLLAHRSPAAAAESWKAFMADPEWQKVWAESKKDGPLVVKVKSLYLRTTDYSPLPFRALVPAANAGELPAK